VSSPVVVAALLALHHYRGIGVRDKQRPVEACVDRLGDFAAMPPAIVVDH